MSRNVLGLIAAALSTVFLALAWVSTWFDVSRPADEWHTESWMGADPKLPATIPTRILSLTDLPPLDPMPGPEDFLAAIEKSKVAGCSGAVLTYSWPSLEPRKGAFTLEELKGAVALNEGRVLYLGIQVLNTTVKEFPHDLSGRAFDDPQLIERFRTFLDGLAPLLQHRVRFLSIGNESDVYLSIHPDETDAFGVFLNAARDHAKHIAPELLVGTTLTDAGAVQLTKNPDAMIRALQKISGRAKLDAPAEVREMAFENPRVGISDMFATHPPIEKRIAALVEFAGGRDDSESRPKRRQVPKTPKKSGKARRPFGHLGSK
ncbi:MAG: M48 family metalloprotease [Candidatus Hydrogenedentes bacterium]|nr:M48 family metalloprotease [Candidatus Hydrogenedentota bacterium]